MNDLDVYGPMKVHVVADDTHNNERPKEYRTSHRTLVLTSLNPYQNIVGYDPGRDEIHLELIDYPAVISGSTSQAADAANGANSVVSTPAFIVNTPATPATGVAVQNPYSVPVQVVIGANGATITAVVVNGITVGTAAGTYYIPAYGSLSISYTVATPTMAWTGIGIPVTVTSLGTPNGRLLSPAVGEYIIPGPDELWISSAQYPNRIGFTVVRCI